NRVAPFFRFDAAGESVGIEGRGADHRQDCAGINIKGNNGSFLSIERRESGLLQPLIHSQVNCVAGNIRHVVEHPDAPTQCVNLDLLSAALPPQDFFPPSFESILSDFVAHRVALVFETFKLTGTDLAQITEDMSPRRSVDITAPRPRAQRHSGKIQLMGFHCDNRRPVHVSTQYDLFKSQPFLILLESRQELVFIPPKIARQEPKGVFWVIGVFGNEKQIERRTTIHHELSLAVNNHSPRSRHSLDTDAIVLRQKGVTFTLDDLEKHEPRDQGQKDDREDIIELTGRARSSGVPSCLLMSVRTVMPLFCGDGYLSICFSFPKTPMTQKTPCGSWRAILGGMKKSS